ncbi:MAG: hypothetical protein OXG99_07440 [Alphaproteobacteria bacterium]|nr:hypothetical protein [Alphaproteobacteria bacterium]
MATALRARRSPAALLLFDGEGHGFRRAENIVAALEAELSFFARILRRVFRKSHYSRTDKAPRQFSLRRELQGCYNFE